MQKGKAVDDNLKQGSEMWLRARSKGIGGSEIAPILGISPYQTAYQLWQYKTGLKQQPDISNLPHVKRGVNGEIVARIMIEREHLVSFKPKSWSIPNTHYRASDDGYSMELGVILEIKCMGKEPHEKMAEASKTNDQNGVPDIYMCQCQYNLWVSGAKECWFYSFRPEDETLYRVVVTPDPKYQEEIKQAVDNFWFNHVQTKEPPEMTNKDFEPLDTPEYAEAAKRFVEIKQQIAELEKELEAAKDEVVKAVGDRPAVRGYGLKISSATRKGSVDYNKIPELKGVVLEKYRKEPSTVVSIRLSAV